MQANSKNLDMFASEVKRQPSALQYLGSRRQLIGVLVTGAVVCSALAMLTGQLWALAGYAIGALAGGLAARANRPMPAQLILTTRGDANNFIADVDALLLKQGYARSYDPAPDDGCVHYRSLAPKWANWGEQGVTVRLEEHQITLDGPIGALWLAHHRITRRDQP